MKDEIRHRGREDVAEDVDVNQKHNIVGIKCRILIACDFTPGPHNFWVLTAFNCTLGPLEVIEKHLLKRNKYVREKKRRKKSLFHVRRMLLKALCFSATATKS